MYKSGPFLEVDFIPFLFLCYLTNCGERRESRCVYIRKKVNRASRVEERGRKRKKDNVMAEKV